MTSESAVLIIIATVGVLIWYAAVRDVVRDLRGRS